MVLPEHAKWSVDSISQKTVPDERLQIFTNPLEIVYDPACFLALLLSDFDPAKFACKFRGRLLG